MLGIFCCLLIASLYVGLLYIWQGLPRDNPKTVARRMASIAVVCLVSWVPTHVLASMTCSRQGKLRHHKQVVNVHPDGQLAVVPTLQLLGLRSDGLLPAVVIPTCLACTLFAAPLLLRAMDIADQRPGTAFFSRSRPWLLTLRDVLVAPVTEEWAFRACMIPLVSIDGWTTGLSVLLVPLFFGAAHLHHAAEMVSYQRLTWDRALRIAGCQMAFTTVFGWYASWLFVRTGHFAAAVVTHMFCNLMGFPDFGRILNHPHHGRLLSAVLVMGIGAFAACLRPLTQPELYHWNVQLWTEDLCHWK